MLKYHDQEYIKTVCREIQNETDENIKAITKQLNELKELAQHEVNKISMFTAPEEVERRQQALCYYQDILEELTK